MLFMSCRRVFKRVLRRIAAPLLMLPLIALMAVGQAAADPLRPGEEMLDYYRHGAVLVTAPGRRAGDVQPLVRLRRCRRHAASS